MNGYQRRSLRAAAKKAADALLVVYQMAEGLQGAERDAISEIRFICHEIEDGRYGGAAETSQ